MRFSIRDLLLVTVIVGLTAGWWVDHQRISAQATKDREFRSSLEEIENQSAYRQPHYKRIWGEKINRPVGEY